MQTPEVQVRGAAAIVVPLLIACNNLKRYATVAPGNSRVVALMYKQWLKDSTPL
jgi:hypothetical protein